MINRGDIWWIDMPRGKPRPGCVITRNMAIPVLGNVTVIPATRTVRGIVTEIVLEERDGMPYRCALTFDNITTVRQRSLSGFIMSLPEDLMDQLCLCLNRMAGCSGS